LEVGSILETDKKNQRGNEITDYSYLTNLTLNDSIYDSYEKESTHKEKLFQCLYCDKFFTSEHLNPYSPYKTNFKHIQNFIHWDELDQGHLCEPFYQYCIQKEKELNIKYSNELNNYEIEPESNTIISEDINQISLMNRKDEAINQFIDTKIPENTSKQLPDDFDEWFSKKLNEKSSNK
jgi:hypothetical protein